MEEVLQAFLSVAKIPKITDTVFERPQDFGYKIHGEWWIGTVNLRRQGSTARSLDIRFPIKESGHVLDSFRLTAYTALGNPRVYKELSHVTTADDVQWGVGLVNYRMIDCETYNRVNIKAYKGHPSEDLDEDFWQDGGWGLEG